MRAGRWPDSDEEWRRSTRGPVRTFWLSRMAGRQPEVAWPRARRSQRVAARRLRTRGCLPWPASGGSERLAHSGGWEARRGGRSMEKAQGSDSGVLVAMAGMRQQQQCEQGRREGQQERTESERASRRRRASARPFKQMEARWRMGAAQRSHAARAVCGGRQ